MRLLIGAAIAIAAPGGAALALDAKQVLKEKKKSRDDVWEKFFSFRKNGKSKEAASTLEYAAEQGDHAAQWKLGKMYETGDGVAKDPAAAVRFYSKIVENYSDAQPGSADWQFTGNAMVVLGRYYRDGVPEAGLRKDRSEAIIMFTTAATYFDHPDAQFELARMYLDDGVGEGDAIQAARMLKLASDQGHAGAHALLGQLLFEGEYLRRDPVRGTFHDHRGQEAGFGRGFGLDFVAAGRGLCLGQREGTSRGNPDDPAAGCAVGSAPTGSIPILRQRSCRARLAGKSPTCIVEHLLAGCQLLALGRADAGRFTLRGFSVTVPACAFGSRELRSAQDGCRQREGDEAFHDLVWRLPARDVNYQTDTSQTSSRTQTGTWSDGFSHSRTCLSMPASRSRSAASGESIRWSMRMPLFFCHAPAW